MVKNKKRYLLFALFVVLLLVVCYANYRINNGPIVKDEQAVKPDAEKSEDSATTIAQGESSFAVFRQDRDSVRTKEIEYLDTMILDKATDKETLKKAQNQKLDLISAMEKEVTIEGLLKVKGFKDVAVTIHKGSVNVVLDAVELTNSDVAKVLDIVRRETKEKAENIKVMPRS